MSNRKFFSVRIAETNNKWEKCVARNGVIYKRGNEIRSEFSRDYNRILHSTAYRRLKHKTQVFFATSNDHICTRVEHVNHVTSVSYTIAKHLGLNTELTAAIAIGHDLGHAPFGHAGETVLKSIAGESLKQKFWHEKNSLRFIDNIETLESPEGVENNLNLTYAVRDGIVSHCGEVDIEALFPRKQGIKLENINKPSQYEAYTWEGCVVKMADKIAYLGRDIEDALALKVLSDRQITSLESIVGGRVNNTILLHNFIIDLCDASSPDNGIRLSKKYSKMMKSIKDFNYNNIYNHDRLSTYKRYAELVIKSIFDELSKMYDHTNTLIEINKYKNISPSLVGTFLDWLIKYSNLRKMPDKIMEILDNPQKIEKYNNVVNYNIEKQRDYTLAIIEYISGMTDSFALQIFRELTSFR